MYGCKANFKIAVLRKVGQTDVMMREVFVIGNLYTKKTCLWNTYAPSGSKVQNDFDLGEEGIIYT